MSRLKRKASQQLIRSHSTAKDQQDVHSLLPVMNWYEQLQRVVHYSASALRLWRLPVPDEPLGEPSKSKRRMEDSHTESDNTLYNTPEQTMVCSYQTEDVENSPPQRNENSTELRRQARKDWVDLGVCGDEAEAREQLDKNWTPSNVFPGKKTAFKPLSPNSKVNDIKPTPLSNPRFSGTSRATVENGVVSQVHGQTMSSGGSLSFTVHATSSNSKVRTLDTNAVPLGQAESSNLSRQLENLFLKDETTNLRRSESKTAQSDERKEARTKQERNLAIRKAQQARLTRRAPSEALIQNLPSKWAQHVSGLCRGDQYKVVTHAVEGTEIRIKDFDTLLPQRAWLNDEIINTYIGWVVEAANEAAAKQAEVLGDQVVLVPKFIAHNSFFYQTLKEKGDQGLRTIDRLMKRKKAPGASLLEVDSVFVPICNHNHWTMGVVRPVAKTIEYFDSMGGNPSTFVKNMRAWLQHQLGTAYVASDWSEPNTRCAHQTNGYDCGVFVCTNAFCVATGLDTSCYFEKDMGVQRRNIAAVLVNKGFKGDFAWRPGRELP